MILPGEIVVQQEAWENACRDAKRYRYMRDGNHNGYLCDWQGEELDKQVDDWMPATSTRNARSS